MQQMVDTNSLAPIDACSLAWSAVGGLVAHLEKCYIAFQLLDHGTFDAYVPGDLNDSVVPVNELSVDELSVDEDGDIVSSDSSDLPAFMTLDVHAIRNLEIFENTYDRGSNGKYVLSCIKIIAINNYSNCCKFSFVLFRKRNVD
jgi:hypothetical protein